MTHTHLIIIMFHMLNILSGKHLHLASAILNCILQTNIRCITRNDTNSCFYNGPFSSVKHYGKQETTWCFQSLHKQLLPCWTSGENIITCLNFLSFPDPDRVQIVDVFRMEHKDHLQYSVVQAWYWYELIMHSEARVNLRLYLHSGPEFVLSA